MRLSRKALATLGVAACLGIGGSLYYALAPKGEKAAKELYNTASRAASETITSGPRDYAQAPRLGPPLPGDLGSPIVSAQQRGENVPVPPIGTQPAQPDPRVQAEEAARQRAQQERDAARMSGVFLGGNAGLVPGALGGGVAVAYGGGDVRGEQAEQHRQHDRGAERAADLAEERGRAGCHAHVAGGRGGLSGERQAKVFTPLACMRC